MFPIDAVLGARATTRLYAATEDLFCYELDAADVQSLLGASPPFQRFCARHVDSLLQQERRALRAAYAAQAVSDRPLLQPLASAIRRAPVTCSPETPLRQALERMQAQQIGAIVVVDADGAPQGIFTERDLVRHAASGKLALEQPISAYMTREPIRPPGERDAVRGGASQWRVAASGICSCATAASSSASSRSGASSPCSGSRCAR